MSQMTPREIVSELDRRARELAGILLELGLQPLEQREGVGGGPGKAADHVAFAEAAHLLGIGLHDGLADGDLAVAADHHAAALADGEDGGAVPGGIGGEFGRGHTTEPLGARHVRGLGPSCKRGPAPSPTLASFRDASQRVRAKRGPMINSASGPGIQGDALMLDPGFRARPPSAGAPE